MVLGYNYLSHFTLYTNLAYEMPRAMWMFERRYGLLKGKVTMLYITSYIKQNNSSL